MSKKQGNALAIAEAAKDAGRHLSAWRAVEANADQLLKAAENGKPSENFAEVHFQNGHVVGVVKAGNVVLKIEG